MTTRRLASSNREREIIPVIDPTANVIALVEANETHSEALRDAHEILDRERSDHVKEIGEIRSRHSKDIADLRAEHSKLMGEKETDRLNAIRQTDVTNSDAKAAAVAAAVSALAATTTTNADNIRTALVNSDSARAKQQEAFANAVNERLLAIERANSEGTGKARFADPVMAELMKDIKIIAANQSVGAGSRGGMRDMAGWIVSAIMGLVAVASLIVAFLNP